MARVCRDAGARVARNVRLADARRIEVVANGLPLWHGSQLAIDATIVSPLTRFGDAHPRADVDPGCALAAAARRKRHQTYPELARARRCRLVVVGVEVGGRFGSEAVQLLRLLARHKAATVPDQQRSRPGSHAGPASSPSLPSAPMPLLCWSCRQQRPSATDRCLSCRLAPAAASPPVAPTPAAVGRVDADEDPSLQS